MPAASSPAPFARQCAKRNRGGHRRQQQRAFHSFDAPSIRRPGGPVRASGIACARIRSASRPHIVPNPSRPAQPLRPRASAVKHPFQSAEFLTTAADWHQLPVDGAPEVAFAGRSNAGKSSAINALAQRTRLAFVSKTPGRTQNINFFRLRSGALLADLPGYGYAEVPAAIRRHWQHFIARYLAERVPLTGLVLVMDARRGDDRPRPANARLVPSLAAPDPYPPDQGRQVHRRRTATHSRRRAASNWRRTTRRMRIESACSYFRRRVSSVLTMRSGRSGAGLRRLRRKPRCRRHKKKGPDIKGSETGPEERPSVGRVTQPKGTRSGRKAGDDAIVCGI